MKVNFEKAVKQGWTHWTKDGKDRLYFNIADNGALDIYRYKSGNVRSAYLDGEKISNSRANRILATRAYLDLKTGETVIVSGDEHDLVADVFEKALKDIQEPEEEEKVTFGGLSFDTDNVFKYYDVFVNDEYVGFAEKSTDGFVFWGSSDNGDNFIGGHIGRYVDGIDYDSLDELKEDLETQPKEVI